MEVGCSSQPYPMGNLYVFLFVKRKNHLKVNHEIRAPRVRVINEKGEQLGVLSIQEAMAFAKDVNLDLVEVVSTSSPPVCKIIDYGKFRYDQTKREREQKNTAPGEN